MEIYKQAYEKKCCQSHKLFYRLRLIDDLISINKKNLKKKKRINKKLQLFRLNYKIKSSRFFAKFYDERDKFNFNVIRIPHKTNDLPRKMFYLAMSAEIL